MHVSIYTYVCMHEWVSVVLHLLPFDLSSPDFRTNTLMVARQYVVERFTNHHVPSKTKTSLTGTTPISQTTRICPNPQRQADKSTRALVCSGNKVEDVGAVFRHNPVRNRVHFEGLREQLVGFLRLDAFLEFFRRCLDRPGASCALGCRRRRGRGCWAPVLGSPDQPACDGKLSGNQWETERNLKKCALKTQT